MTSFRVTEAVQRAGRDLRPARFVLNGALAAAAALTLPTAAGAASAATESATAAGIARQAPGESIGDFFRARNGRPFWFAAGNEQAIGRLLDLLGSANVDGLDPSQYDLPDIQRVLRSAWGGNPTARGRAEVMLSQAFAAYAADVRRTPDNGVIYVDPQLRPRAPTARALLEEAAAAPSLEQFIDTMGWMHPYYAGLRKALVQSVDEQQRALLTVNLERARALPPATSDRYVLVNAAAQRLYMFDRGRVQDTMRVVVGKPHQQTPMMAALIRFTSLNPYWNVPPDLVAERVAPYVVKDGLRFLKAKGYEVLSDWTANAKPVDPATIDWQAVQAGKQEIRVRQLPGAANSMGAMKFMFPNAQGVYLHDTPSTELFSEAARLFSGGCVRLEAAPRLAAWLHGKPLHPNGAEPEQRVDLPSPVPVYLTYLTAVPGEAGEVAFFDDSYGRDAARLAELQRNPSRRAVASR